MTTLGVVPAPKERIMPINIPSYAYQYPSLKTVRLAAVKEGIYHPHLPTFRRMDMDSNAHKLPEEHCRTSTHCGPRDFAQAKSSIFEPPKTPLHSMGITDTGRQLHRTTSAPEELRKARLDWSKFLDRCPERYNIRLPEIPGPQGEIHFDNYAVRYLRPEVTSSWKYTLRPEPSLDQYGQRPIPANIYARYRDTVPQYKRNVATEAWRSY